MKRARLYLFATGLIAVFAVLFNSCTSPTEGMNFSISPGSMFKAPLLVRFNNANPTSAVKPDEFDITITGEGAELVQMDGGGTDFKALKGFLPLALTNHAQPTEENPVKFTIHATIPGFLPVIKSVSIKSDEINVIEITAVELSNPAEGVAVLTTTTPLTGNAIAAETTLTVSGNAGMEETAEITFSPGTKFLNASGQEISASQLSSTVVNFSAVSETSATAFPGGYEPNDVILENGQPAGDGFNFISAGLISINMKAGNTDVKGFTQPVTVSMEINPDTTNPVTGNPVQAGDEVPVWSMDEITGQWKYEGVVSITNGGNGKPVASYEITHLSYYNLDWYWYYGSGTGYISTCYSGYTVNYNGNPGTYLFTFKTPGGQYLTSRYVYKYSTGAESVSFYNSPNTQQRLTITKINNAAVTGTSALYSPCSAGTVSVSLPAEPAPEYVNVNVKAKAKCNNKNITLPISGWLYLYDYTTYQYSYIYVYNGNLYYAYGLPISGSNGNFTTQMVAGRTYWIETYQLGRWMYNDFVLTKSSFNLPTVGGFSGNAAYTAGNNTLTLNVQYGMTCY